MIDEVNRNEQNLREFKYARHVRAYTWVCAIALTACRPSATVERTMPVANLQSYRTVGLRVQSTAFAAQGLATFLETAVLEKLRQSCRFDQIGRPGATPSDVLLDLNITNTGRGGGGWIQNQNQASIDTLLVLTDGQSGELIGTARIRGTSSGIIVNNNRPENEAIDVVAKTVAELLSKSGCSGPRVAKTEPPPPKETPPPPPPQGSNTPPPPDESKRAEAETLNEQGKDKLRGADLVGALAAFQQANTLVPDAKYQYNICLTYEAQAKWDDAVAACKKARGMNPPAKLVAKIDHRLELLANKQ